MEIAEFLLARIAEDEEVVGHCLEAVDGDRTEYAQQLARRTGPYSTVTSSSHCGQDMGPRGTVEATPGRVLAECQAKRKAVEAWQKATEVVPPGPEGWHRGLTAANASGLHYAMRLLSLPYADHPDFREEWAPVAATSAP